MTTTQFIGIDFSGNHRMWGPGVSERRSNVWIAELGQGRQRFGQLLNLRPVQQLPGSGPPFVRLVQRLQARDFEAAAIDAPFSIPSRYLPVGGWRELVRHVGTALQFGRRPFPSGAQLVEWRLGGDVRYGARCLRATEQHWRAQEVRVRPALWNGGRPGAPFTVAALSLLHHAACPVWPWESEQGALVEAFPAAQLRHWGLPFMRYNGMSANAVQCRQEIIERLQPDVELGRHVVTARASADALDAVLCALAAAAVVQGSVLPRDTPDGDEGAIAVAS